MNARIAFFLVLLAGLWTACSSPVGTTITNPLNEEVNELVVEITAPEILQKAATMKHFKLMDGDTEVPYQLIADGDQISSILAQVNFAPNEEKTISITNGHPAEFAKKTQAEISVKEGGVWEWVKKKNGKEQYEYIGGTWKNVDSLWVDPKHTDHSFDIRYEGPGWESDKIAYRFYLDWRNAVDIFGKKTDSMVLQQVGLDGFDSYHEMSDWGADILKVGDALGIGTIAHWANGKANRVAVTDSLYSEITMNGDLEYSRDILIENINFNNNDDNVAVKAGRDDEGRAMQRPSENIIIRNCHFKGLHAVVMGSEMSSGVRNVFVEDCDAAGYLKRGIYLKSNPDRGGEISNVFVKNVHFGEVLDCFMVTSNYHNEGTVFPTNIHSIYLEKVSCQKAENYAIYLKGHELKDVHGFVIKDFKVDSAGRGVHVEHAENIRFGNVVVNNEEVVWDPVKLRENASTDYDY